VESASYKLFPCIGNSARVIELLDFSYEIRFKPSFAIFFKDSPLLTVTDECSVLQCEWLGDAANVQLRFPKKSLEFFLKILCRDTALIIEVASECAAFLKFESKTVQTFNLQTKRADPFTLCYMTSIDDPLQYDLNKSFSTWWNLSSSWLNSAPKTNRYIQKGLWDYCWILPRVNEFPTQISPSNGWVLGYRGKANGSNRLYHSLMIIEDLMWYRPDLAKMQLLHFFDLWRESDGMIGHCKTIQSKDPQKILDVTLDFNISQSPLWSFFILDYFKLTGDQELVRAVYEKCKANILWWETHRFHPDYQLFYSSNTVQNLADEADQPLSPRFYQQFDGRSWKNLTGGSLRKIIPIDLNAQMSDYYQSMGIFGTIVEDPECGTYFQKAESLQDRVQDVLWDTETKFFYDFDLDTKKIQPMKTIAGFWSLFGGLAKKSQVVDLLSHLMNPKEFWAELPVPSLAMDEKLFSKEIWHGSVSLTQNFWLLIGLKRYNLNQQVAKLTDKVFKYMNSSFELYNSVYEYYPPMSFNVNSLTMNGKTGASREMYLANLPLHSIFYRGLLGAEILDDSINFIPDWTVLDKEVNFGFYYRNQKMDVFLDRSKKILEFNAP